MFMIFHYVSLFFPLEPGAFASNRQSSVSSDSIRRLSSLSLTGLFAVAGFSGKASGRFGGGFLNGLIMLI